MTGAAFLALWNGIDSPALQPEYDAWHTLEHVPERVGLPGFLEGRRYRSLDHHGSAPASYFTWYALQSRGALSTPRYREVVAAPTAWSARMRPHLTAFLRLPCDTLGHEGQGHGSRIAVLRIRPFAPTGAEAIGAWFRGQVGRGHAVAATWGACVPDDGYPLGHADSSVRAGDLVVVLEHVDVAPLQALVETAPKALAPHGEATARPTLHELLSSVRQGDLVAPLEGRQPARPDLQAAFGADGRSPR